jgi:radical SAM protein (TIGR04043 family)
VDYQRKVRAAAVQISPVLFSREGTTDKVLKSIEEAAQAGAELVVFPETLIPYYPYFSFIQPPVLMGKEHLQLYEEAVEVPSPVTTAVSQAAKTHQIVVVLGITEREGGSLYNAQLIFDADGTLLLKRRKITPTYHERMVWGQGDGSGLQVQDTAVGKVGALACWEHYNPLARFTLMTQQEQIHCAQFPGSMVGQIFADQIEVTIRHHALEAGCFVVNSTSYLSPAQVSQITPDQQLQGVLQGGCYTTIISPEGVILSSPITTGEGMAIADLDFNLITKRKRMMDSIGHYSRPDLFQLQLNQNSWSLISNPDQSSQLNKTEKEVPDKPMNKQKLITELQSKGLKLLETETGASGRKGGAGPSDHKAITIDGTTIMVPIYTNSASQSPYTTTNQTTLLLNNTKIATISFPPKPKFYELTTSDGIPYWKIALLHSNEVLATTVLQTCKRYRDSDTVCQFCAIEKSLAADRTIARKTPQQLAEVTAAAVRLDGVKHLVMTSGTPNTSDRGAAYLAECAQAIKQQTDIPIQAQCEPPDDFNWFQKLKDSGVDSLGMHLEAITPAVRAKIMPGKAEVSVEYYFQAFAAAVEVFGRGQVSTYLLAGLGDTIEALVAGCDRLIQIGVYPFVVPFTPITGTPLENHPAPSSEMMFTLYQQIGAMLKKAGMSAAEIKAGCGKCGACSGLSTFEI